MNGGLPRCLESQEPVCVHVGKSRTEVEEDVVGRLMRRTCLATGEEVSNNYV